MAQESYKVSVPGSMMLMGEHAVLDAHQAIVCAVNKRIHMKLTPSVDRTIRVSDTRLGEMTVPLDSFEIKQPFKFVLAVIEEFKDKIPSGFNLEITADFSSTIGLGSSAAVIIATIGILSKWLHPIPLSENEILILAKNVLMKVQGRGSGADLAASLYGGVVAYKIDANEKLPCIPNLTAIYSGYKTSTAEVIEIVSKAKELNSKKFSDIYAKIDDCAMQGIEAIQASDWPQLGRLFTQHQQLQVELGVSDHLLDHLVAQLERQPQIYGAKISGAGLGDCVIGLGTVPHSIIEPQNGIEQFTVEIDQRGLIYASN